MSSRIMAVMKPVLDQFQIVPNAATVNPNPMNPLNPFPLKSILLEGFAAQAECFGGLLFINELNHSGVLAG